MYRVTTQIFLVIVKQGITPFASLRDKDFLDRKPLRGRGNLVRLLQ